MLIEPSELRYTHDSIANHFRNGTTLEDSLWRLLRNLPEVNARIGNMPRMQVMQYGGLYYVVGGNRRLYLLKKLQSEGIITDVDVVVLQFNESRFDKQHTTKCEGLHIRVRHRPDMGVKLSHIIAKYRRKKIGLPVSDDDSDDDAVGGFAYSVSTYDDDFDDFCYGWVQDDSDEYDNELDLFGYGYYDSD